MKTSIYILHFIILFSSSVSFAESIFSENANRYIIKYLDLSNNKKISKNLTQFEFLGLLPECLKFTTQGFNDPWLGKNYALNLYTKQRRISPKIRSILSMYIQKGDINKQDENGNTMLMIAAKKGQFQIVEHLLKNNADPNIPDEFGRTPLMMAADRGDYYLCKLLLENKANINTETSEGDTALIYAVGSDSFKLVYYLVTKGATIQNSKKSALMESISVSVNSLLITKTLIYEPNSNIGFTEKGKSALDIVSGRYFFYKRHLNKRAEKNLADEKGRRRVKKIERGDGEAENH